MNALDVKNIRKKLKLTQSEFADLLSVHIRTIQNWENGTEIPKSKISAILRIVESNKTNDNEEINSKKEIILFGKHTPGKRHIEGWKGLPMYNVPITASFVETYRDDGDVEPQYYLYDPRFKDCDFGAIITGDSMHSEIRHGDFVACKEIVDKRFIVFGDIYYIVSTNGLETCKYINAGKDDDHLCLQAKNEKISQMQIPKEMVLRLYKVRGIVRGY